MWFHVKPEGTACRVTHLDREFHQERDGTALGIGSVGDEAVDSPHSDVFRLHRHLVPHPNDA